VRVKKSLKAPFLHTLYHADRLHLMWCAHGSGLGHSDPRAGRGVMGEEQSRGVNQGGSIEEDYSRIINQGESINGGSIKQENSCAGRSSYSGKSSCSRENS